MLIDKRYLFSDEKINIMLEMQKKGSVTKKTQGIFRGFGFYINMWELRDDGLAKENGLTKDKEKIWMLTEKGLNLVKDLKKLRQINKHIGEIMNA